MPTIAHVTDVGCKFGAWVKSNADRLGLSAEDGTCARVLSILHGKSHSWTCEFLHGILHNQLKLGHWNGEVRESGNSRLRNLGTPSIMVLTRVPLCLM